MDFFVTNKNWEDLGRIYPISIDMGIGEENTFDIEVDTPFDYQALIYAPGTEFGGIIDGDGIKTSDGTTTYKGRTWHGILEGKVIKPPQGQLNRKVSGDANKILQELIDLLNLGDIFTASTKSSKWIEHTFDRWSEGYSAIRKMLYANNLKLKVSKGYKVELSAQEIDDHSKADLESFSTDIEMETNTRPVNHLVCLGEGEGLERVTLDLYANDKGQVTVNGSPIPQFFFGADEVAEIYDYNNADLDELREKGIEKLEALQEKSQIAVFIEDEEYDIDDTVAAYISSTGVYGTARVTEKILRVDSEGHEDIQMKAGSLTLKQIPNNGSQRGNLTYVRTIDPSEASRVINGDTWVNKVTRQEQVYDGGWTDVTATKSFTATPEPPYIIGDTWSTDDGVLVCTAAKTLGEEFSADDWKQSLGKDGKDATLVCAITDNGTVFKNSDGESTISIIVFHGAKKITDIDSLKAEYGNTARIQWSWELNGNTGIISVDDERIINGSMSFLVSSADVDASATIQADLVN